MKTESKIRILLIVFFVALFCVFLRSLYWQALRHEDLSIAADEQHFYSLDISSSRGQMKTSDGFSLVSNKQSYVLYANIPELNEDPKTISEKFTPILVEGNPLLATTSAEVKELTETMEKKLRIDNAVWVRLASGLSDSTKGKVLKLSVKGLVFLAQTTRDYPEGTMAAQILGFVSEGRKGLEGNFGLEGYYQDELKGRDGKMLEEKDAFGRPILVGNLSKQDKSDGSDLELTVDRTVQSIVEKYLSEGIVTWGATGGTAVVMDPYTGDILGAASFPRYDPKNYYLFSNKTYKDPMISDLYEPGSIMKPLIMAAAINEGKITSDSKCPVCNGPRTIGGFDIHTFDNKYHPNLNMTEVLINSDNTGMIYVGETLGFDKVHEYLGKYGFGHKTGIDLQGEETGTIRPRSQWYALDQASVTFGQGIAVNPLQMARAMSVIANGGKLVTPRVVKAIVDSSGKRKELKPKIIQGVISLQTSKLLTEMLVRVANESPLHFPRERTVGMTKYRVAAKSGTAQIPLAGHYEEGRIIGSVMGFAPAGNPKFVVLVKLDSPSVRQWGSDTAGPVFFNIVSDLLSYYGIPPQ